MIISIYIAGRCRICQSVDEPAFMRGLDAIWKRLPELSIQGRVIVTAEYDGVTYLIPLQQEPKHDHQDEYSAAY